MRIIGRDAPAVKLNLNFRAAFIRKRLRYCFFNYFKIIKKKLNLQELQCRSAQLNWYEFALIRPEFAERIFTNSE